MKSEKLMICWDLDVSFSSDPALLGRIASELADCGLDTLHLNDNFPELSEEAVNILESLSGRGIKLLLTADSSVFNGMKVHRLADCGISNLFIRVSSLDQLFSRIEDITAPTGRALGAGVSFLLSGDTFGELAGMMRTCAEHGIRHMHLPVQCLSADQEIFCYDQSDLDALCEELEGVPFGQMRISVRDPLLGEALLNGNGKKECCRAARGFFHIASNFDLLPCVSIPVPLGNLYKTGLSEVLAGEKAARMREMLSAAPSECSGCAKAPACKGGCRGRSYGLHGIFERKDPACPVEP